ncbi:DUF5597 domain-containing protein [Candidatus Latescibacterota bacterium]
MSKTVLKILLISVMSAAGIAIPLYAENAGDIPHLEMNGTAKQLIVDGKPFIILGGELHNSSSSSLAHMEPVWDKLAGMNLNTVIMPVSWELVEPVEGEFDFSLVDGLLRGAREHDLKLVLLWFGSWKNAVSSYVPSWVKTDYKRFPRVKNSEGESREVLSCFGKESLRADSRAFAAFMKHLGEVDRDDHTVIMVQVENETGLLNDSRDRSQSAERAFRENVPSELIDYLSKHKKSLIPEMREIWAGSGFAESGTWTEVFGSDADEVFMAWHLGSYIGAVAEAGKTEYPLPLFVNAWLVQDNFSKPGQYPSGGPVSKMMDVWRAAAPVFELYAPDIYDPGFKAVCERYVRSGNPLFIPEAHRDFSAVPKTFYTVAEHDGIGFAPYGIDEAVDDHPLGKTYRFFTDIMPLITEYQGTGNMAGFMETDETTGTVELGDYILEIDYDMFGKGDAPGYGLIIALAPDEYLMAGSGFWVTFSPKHGDKNRVGILSADECWYKDSRWTYGRRLNGDGNDGGLRAQFLHVDFLNTPRELPISSGFMPPMPVSPDDFTLQRIKVYTYK